MSLIAGPKQLWAVCHDSLFEFSITATGMQWSRVVGPATNVLHNAQPSLYLFKGELHVTGGKRDERDPWGPSPPEAYCIERFDMKTKSFDICSYRLPSTWPYLHAELRLHVLDDRWLVAINNDEAAVLDLHVATTLGADTTPWMHLGAVPPMIAVGSICV